jgi:argininosuccinate lyase
LELTRGKAGRVIGSLQSLFVLVKGLPLAYNRDLQEDKEAVFEAFDTVNGCLAVAAPLVEETKLRREVIESRLEDGFLDATTLMESLIARGVPMRSAHEAVGKLVRTAEQQRCRLVDLSDTIFEEVAPGAGKAIKATLGVKNAIMAFQSYGSTQPLSVDQQLHEWQQRLA